MSAVPTATFVVEPQTSHGYRVTAAEGPAASRLGSSALAVLELLGPASASGPERIHAWLGPVGPQGEYVRVAIDRLPDGRCRYRQAWFGDKDLPPHPARVGFSPDPPELPEPSSWPGDLHRVLECARRSAESGTTEWVGVPASADALAYCRALTEVLGTPPGNRLTWITHAPAAAVPVHLQFRADAAVPAAPPVHQLPAGEPRLRQVVLVPVPKASGQSSRNGKPRRRWGLMVGLLFVFGVGAAAGWFGRDGLSNLPLFGSAGGVLPGQPPKQPDPRVERLNTSVSRSQDAREKLKKFFSQDGLAAPPGADQGAEKITVSIQSGPEQDPVKLKNTEVRQILDLLQSLDELQKKEPPQR